MKKASAISCITFSDDLGPRFCLKLSTELCWLGLSTELKGIGLGTIHDWLGLNTELEGLGLSTATTD